MNQPTAAPTNKVAAAGISGAITILVVYLVDQIAGVAVPPEVASAGTAIISTAIAYLTPNKEV